jgi:hypothetical protein
VLRTLHVPSTLTSLIIRNQNALTDFTCPSLSNISTLWLENVGTTVDTLAILQALNAGARVRLFGFYWSLDNASEISDAFDVLDGMRGLDQNGDNMTTAQVYGTVYVPSVTGDIVAHARARYPDITIAYDHVSAVLTYMDYDGTVLGTETILDGAYPTGILTPGDKEDNRYYYTFLGWGRELNGEVDGSVFDDITSDTTAYAIYALKEKLYTVRIFNGSTLIATFENVAYGSSVTYEGIPEYNGVGNAGDYVFTGWSEDLENITSDLDCYAEYQFVGLYFRQLLNGTLVAFENQEIVTMAAYAFAGEANLETISMSALTAVPENCFRGCTALTDVDMPEVIAVNDYSFGYCSTITKLKLPKMQLMNTGVPFYYMNSLTELRLPKNTSSFEGNKISNCSNLALLDVGETTALGMSFSVSGFSNLETMILRNTSQVVTPYATTIFHASSPIGQGTGHILVPRSMLESYKADSAWGAYSAVLDAIEDFPEICE